MDRKLKRHFLRFRRRGDASALAKVFDLTAPELASVARYLVKDSATAEDIVQATYLTAIEKSASYDESQAVMPWLVGILAKHAAKARRKAARAPDPELLGSGTSEDPAMVAEHSELGELIEGHIRELPQTYGPAVHSFLTEGRPPREIGRELGISAGAASVRLHRGLKLLRQSLPSGAAMGVAPPLLPLDGLRERLLSSVTKSASTTTLAKSSTLTLGSLMLKHQIILATSAAILGVGAYQFLGSDAEPSTSSNDEAQAPIDSAHSGAISEPAGDLLGAIGYVTDGSEVVEQSRSRVEDDPSATPSAEDWLRRLLAASGPREARGIFRELAALDPAAGLEIMNAIYARIPDPEYREAALDAFAESGHEHAIEVLHLGATDTAMSVQGHALGILSIVAFQDFEASFDAYSLWRARFSGQSFAQVLTASAREYARRVASLSDDDLLVQLRRFEDLDLHYGIAAGVDLASVLIDAGILESLARWMELEDRDAHQAALRWAGELNSLRVLQDILDGWLSAADPERRAASLRYLARVDSDEPYLRERVFPILQDRANHTPEEVEGAIQLLGRPGFSWAVDALLRVLLDPNEGVGRFFGVSSALAKIGDPRVIPTMIAVIIADDTYDSIYGVGYFGLRKLTGVEYDETHDGDFWRNWWASNQSRLPEEVRGMSLPFVSFDK